LNAAIALEIEEGWDAGNRHLPGHDLPEQACAEKPLEQHAFPASGRVGGGAEMVKVVFDDPLLIECLRDLLRLDAGNLLPPPPHLRPALGRAVDPLPAEQPVPAHGTSLVNHPFSMLG